LQGGGRIFGRVSIAKNKDMKSRSSFDPTFGSLFSGCGGFDEGFRARGIRPIAAFDIDRQAVEAYNANLPSVGRVLDLNESNPELSRPDVLIAGSPCQGFSTSGKRLIADPRNRLIIRAGQIALELRPKVFILENVPTAISGNHGKHWFLVEDMLRWHGYNVRRFLAEGPDSGVAQLRRRLFLIAWLGSDCTRIEPPAIKGPSLRTALQGVEQLTDYDPIFLKPASREFMIAQQIPVGKKLSNVRNGTSSIHTWDIPKVFGAVSRNDIEVLNAILRLRRRDRKRTFGDADPVLASAVSQYLGRPSGKTIQRLIKKRYLRRVDRRIDLTHTYNGKFRRLDWDQPSPTVDTHFGDPALFLHPDEQRGFTPREGARIQGFPDSFKFPGGRGVRFEMIGNAVPPPMGMRLASFVRTALL
jgi:DNA (cytosine-5)-methyltransferase 1